MEPYRVLLVIDMQNDFANKDGGSFYVNNDRDPKNPNVPSVRDNIVNLILNRENYINEIIATKDFHPEDHVSFQKFPPHCIQKKFRQGDIFKGHKNDYVNNELDYSLRSGAKFHPEILNALRKSKCKQQSVFFKAFFKHFDSFGGVSYTPEYAGERELAREDLIGTKYMPGSCHNTHCMNAFTGSYKFPLTDPADIDSDPEFRCYNENASNATTYKDSEHYHRTYLRLDNYINDTILKKNTGKKIEIYICGLALDFCVKDTAVNLRTKYKDKSNVDIKVILDASGAAFPDFISKVHNGNELQNLYIQWIDHIPKTIVTNIPESNTDSTNRISIRQQNAFNAHVNRKRFSQENPWQLWKQKLHMGGGSKSLRTNLLWNAGFLLLATFIASVVPR
jgi:nicotinamidase-related amidase